MNLITYQKFTVIVIITKDPYRLCPCLVLNRGEWKYQSKVFRSTVGGRPRGRCLRSRVKETYRYEQGRGSGDVYNKKKEAP